MEHQDKKKNSFNDLKIKNSCINNSIYDICHTCIYYLYGIFLYPRSPEWEGGYTVLPLSVLPSVQDIFRRIFLSNY